MKHYQYKRQKGFIGIVFLVIALIGIVIAAIAAMSRSSSTGTADQTTKTNASVLMKQASDFKTGMDRMIVNGTSAATITFDNTVNTGLFDPTPGAQYAIRHVPPSRVVVSGTPAFTYTRQVQLPGIGSQTSADFVTTVGNLTLAACQQINNLLYNDAITALPATSAGTMAAWTTTPAAIDDSGSVAANYLNRPEGCVAAMGGTTYLYYKALVEN